MREQNNRAKYGESLLSAAGRKQGRSALLIGLLVCFSLLLVPLLPVAAAASDARFLAREDIVLYGMQLSAAPAKQTVPKNIATIVSTFMQVPTLPAGQIPPLPADATVKATLRGPGLPDPVELSVAANSPFTIPPMTVPGIYSLDGIRLESGGQVMFYGTPESVSIEVIENLLVTQVTARPLTAQEIRDKGIVFDKTNFQAYSFSAAFAIAPGKEINIAMPVVLPRVQTTSDVLVDGVAIPSIPQAQIQSVATIIPDALRIAQTAVPNLNVQSFTLKPTKTADNNFYLPPIPGVVVIPGDIGFLNQYFSVMLMVGNAAPDGSNLVVKDLKAEIILPPGNDQVLFTADDPLRMAVVAQGESPRVVPVAQPGPDGKLGTADDLNELAPGQTGNAEFLVEGRREGSHTVEMQITGTLYGLPAGPIPISGRAMGTVLVRNPTFTMTFTHPDLVSAGEHYTLDVTVTNTSESPANFVSVNLYPRYISGAALVGDPVQSIESIPPGDSATVSYELVSQVSGSVFAATLDSDEHIKGIFQLKTSVGELGIPLSPDSLVLPKEANFLPKGLRDAAIGLLGKAYATATAPAAALPKDVLRFGKKIVWDRGIELAEAGFRYSLHEELPATASQLLMDYMGSNFNRIAQLYPAADQDAERGDFTGFDDLRRRSTRGDVLAQAVADILKDELSAKGTLPFHRDLATRLAYRPGFISVLANGDGGPAPVTVTLVDGGGKRLGGSNAAGKTTKEIPFSDYLNFSGPSGSAGQLAILAAPSGGTLSVQIAPVPGVTTASYTLSLVYPDATGTLRQASWPGLTTKQAPLFTPGAGDPVTITLAATGSAVAPSGNEVIADLPPSIVSVVQQPQADVFRCDSKDPGKPLGRVVALLFSEEVTPESVQDKLAAELITSFSAEANKVVGVALQPGRRVAFLALRDPLGPFIPRILSASGVADLKGHLMLPQSVPMEATITDFGGVVSGKVLQADGSAVPGAEVRLVLQTVCPDVEGWIDVGIAAKPTDANARYQWDYVRGGDFRVKEVAIDPNTGDVRRLLFSVARHGQRLNADIVFLGRGTIQGRVFAEDGVTPLKDVQIKVTNLVDQTEYGATTDANGRYTVARVPIGNSLLEAIHVASNSHLTQSTYIGSAGSVVELNLVLLSETVQQITVQHGQLSGTVLRPDGTTPVGGVPVVAYYQDQSQPGVLCPGDPRPPECPVALVNADKNGAYLFASLIAGTLRINSFDQAVYQQGNIMVTLPADGKVKGNVLLKGGFGTVRGTVLDAVGKPVAGAQVGGGLVLASSDAAGAYELKDVPVGHAQVVAVSQALGSSGTAEIDIIRDGEVVNATIVLSAVGGVYGTVSLADGTTPAVGVDVYALKKDPATSLMTIVGSAVSDAQGRYQIQPLQVMTSEDYTISAFLPDLSDGNLVQARVLFNGHQAKADLSFKGKGKVDGVVYDADGVTPLKARVSVSGLTVLGASGPGGKQVGLEFRHTQNIVIIDTDFSTGRFAFDGVFLGQFVITAGGAFSPDPVLVADELSVPGETRHEVLKLQPTSVITGKVYQPDGFTLVGAAVKVTFSSNESKTFCTVNETTGEDSCQTIPQGIQEEIEYTGADGVFKMPIVNAGQFTLNAEDPVTGKVARLKGNVAAGQTAEVTLRLMGQADVKVRVFGSDGVTPILGAKVELEEGDFPKLKRSGVAVDGSITFGGIDEGTFAVFAQDLSRGFSARSSGKVVKDGQGVTLDVHLYDATGVVYGTVYRADGVTPVPNADVSIFNAQGPLAFNVTDGSGQYRQDTIPLGAVSVAVFEAATGRRGGGSGSIDLAGQQVPITVNEAAVGHVKGVVFDAATMAPLRAWTVTLSAAFPDGSSLSVSSTTGTDGSYFFPGIPQGEFTVSASRESLGSTTARGVIARENELINLPLVVSLIKPALGRIEGVVLNQDGTPAADYSVCIDPLDIGCLVQLTAGSDGTFAADGLALTRHLVRASSQVAASSGSSLANLSFSGQASVVKIVVNGLGGVAPTVVWQDNTPAKGVQLVLEQAPDAGCGSPSCSRFADQSGAATFGSVPPGSYTIWAYDPVSKMSAAASDILQVGDLAHPRLVLEVNGSVTGSALYPDALPRAGIIASLVGKAPDGSALAYYTATDAAGAFSFRGVKIGSYTLDLVDPLGSGLGRKVIQVAGSEDAGTIILDAASPAVQTVDPVPGALRVPLGQKIVITFNKPIKPGLVSADTVKLSDASAPVTGTLAVGEGFTTVSFTPVNPLKEQTVYTLQVSGITDSLDRPMAKPFLASFTTVDLTPPALQSVDPAAAATGVPLESVVRVLYSEPVDLAAFSGPAIVLTRGGAAVAGRIDPVFGNTGLVFTPTYPLVETGVYHVELLPATDLSGNRQATGLSYDFSALDRTPPVVVGLSASNNGSVIQGSSATVTADTGSGHDVAYVDFLVNGAIVATDRSGPFTLSFQAVAALGKPGDTIKVSAVATDTSGNRGSAVDTYLSIAADTPPLVAITAPAQGASFKTGERVSVSIAASDDLGVAQLSYQAVGGVPPAAASADLQPALSPAAKEFAFYVPVDAVPGSSITVNATAVDTRGQSTKAQPVSITVLDATPPQVGFVGLSSGAAVKPGQKVTAVVSASDLGGVASLEFKVTGATVYSETRSIDPPQNSAGSSFSFSVSPAAGAGSTLALDVSALDKAGNRAAAPQVLLPVSDAKGPQVGLRTLSGSSGFTPGQTVTVVADASDDVGVQRIDLAGSGALNYSNSKGISPPLGSAQAQFAIITPADLADGATLTLTGTALDISGNPGTSAPLTLTARALPGVTLPASLTLNAGDQKQVELSLAAPAPASGVVVSIASANPAVALGTPTVIFAAGEQVKQITVSGSSGGSTQLRASIGSVERASLTVTVSGGIVAGTVYNPYPTPVAGAEVVVNGYSVSTDASGRFSLAGIAGPWVSIRANDTASHLQGYFGASMNMANGYLKNVQVQLVPAAALKGSVFKADGVTSAGAGVQVEVFRTGDLSTPLDTVFTDAQGAFAFPLLQVGSYLIDVASTQGDKGRASAAILQSGLDVTVNVSFLGKGTVTGVVVDGAAAPVANPELRLGSYSLFGSEQRSGSGNPDGTFSFNNVFMGDFSLSAKDPVTRMSAGASGKISANNETVNLILRLASIGSITGTVYRFDGVTPASGATVSAGSATTTTDTLGSYLLQTIPLGVYPVTSDDQAARSRSRASVTLSANGATVPQDLTLPGQGSVVATVSDANGPVGGAQVTLNDGYGALAGLSDPSGVSVFNKVQAGSFTLHAQSGKAGASASGSVTSGGSTPVSITLPVITLPVGTIRGTVYAPDGKTPFEGARVTTSVPGYGIEFLTGADGGYRFDNLPMGSYDLRFSESGMLRAKTLGLLLSQDGQTAVNDATLVGLGSVNGRVLMPDSSSASSFRVSVQSLNPDFGRSATAITDAAGYYLVERLPVGAVAVSTGDPARQLLGEASGTLNADGDTVSADIILQNNAFTPPRTLTDGNLYSYDIQGDGTLAHGEAGIFASRGAAALDLVAGSSILPFTGDPIATQEDQARELAFRQQGLAGLNVTRKVYVPRDGYFARYLEIFSNPTAAPVTVDLQLTTGFKANPALAVQATSSGAGTPAATTRDLWATLDDNAGSAPAVALVWGNAGGASPAAPLFSAAPTTLAATWQGVSVPPGESIALLHFVVQETDPAAARSAAERLVQLPPEALAGLSGDELSAIRNFAVPSDGSSSLESLPSLTGEITGQVLASDALTPAPNGTPVYLASDQPLFGRSYQAATDGSGIFRFTSNLFTDHPSLGIPLTGFTLKARVGPGAYLEAPPVTGSFVAGSTSTAKNIVVSNSAILSGTVLSHTGQPLSGVSVRIVSGAYTGSLSTGLDGSYRFAFLAPGSYSVTAEKPSSQGSGIVVATTTALSAGSEKRLDLSFPGAVNLTGTVRGASAAPAVGAAVRLSSASGFQRTTSSDGAGAFVFVEVPAGSYTVGATEPGTGFTTSAAASVGDSSATPVSLTFPGSGRVAGSVVFADGVTPVAGVLVELFDAATSALLKSVTSGTGFDTGLLMSDAASLKVRGTFSYATPSGSRSVVAEQVLSGFGGSNVTLPATLTLPANLTTLRARLLLADSRRYLGDSITVEARSTADSALLGSCSSDLASGECLLSGLVADAAGITVRAVGDGASLAQQQASVTGSGGTTIVDLTLTPSAATLPVTWYNGNGAPYGLTAEGRVTDGLNGLFGTSGSGSAGGEALELNVAGTSYGFTGGSATLSPNGKGRELVLRQDNLAGLTVVRRIAVPADGYFVRYLDTLINTGATPVTVGLALSSQLAAPEALPQLVGSSSGSSTLQPVTDGWASFDDTVQDDPFLTPAGNLPPSAVVWQGAGAPQPADILSYSAGGALRAGWSSVAVPAGGAVQFLHVATQQGSRSGAAVSAARLALLPPEILTGLSGPDRGAIRNFQVPASGPGTQPALPPLDGAVIGKVISTTGVGVAPAGTQVLFNSQSPCYGRGYLASTDAAGGFAFLSSLDQGSASVGIPRESYTLSATVTLGSLSVGTAATGNFGQGVNSSTRDLYFSFVPGIGSLAPGQIYANQGAVVVQVNGNNFTAGSQVLLDGQLLTTAYLSGHALKATVPTQVNAASRQITVRTPDPFNPGSFATSAGTPLSVVLPQFALTVNPLVIRQMGSGTVTLDIPFPAPAPGVTALLASSDPTSLTVPDSVTIAAGASSVSFAASAPDTTQNRDVGVTIHANQGNWIGGSTSVTVRPEPVVNLTPTSILTGQGYSFFLTVSLTDPAPAGGLLVTLAAGTPNVVTLPASVNIAAGASLAQVTVVNTGTGSTVITATPPAGKGFAAGDACAATVRPVQTYNIGPTLTVPVGVQVGTPVVPPQPHTQVAPLLGHPVGIVVGAVFTGLSPDRAAIGTQNQVVRVLGTGLGAVTDLSFYPVTGITVHAGSLNVAADGTYAEVTIDVAPDAPITPRIAVVKDSVGRIVPASPSANRFLVTHPEPQLWSLIPNVAVVGSTITLQVNGRNLFGASAVSFTPGDGITAGSDLSVSADGTLATISLSIDAVAATGTRAVSITTPGGITSTLISLGNSFKLTPVGGPFATYPQIVAPLVGVMVQHAPAAPTTMNIPVASPTVGVSVGAILSGILPPSGAIGTSNLALHLTGVGLSGVTSVSMSPPDGVTLGAAVAAADGRYLDIPVSIAADAPLTQRVVILQTASGRVPPATPDADRFRVTLPQPELYGLAPIRREAGSSFALSLSGQLLAGATQVRFLPADGITVSNPPAVSADGKLATVNLSIAAGAPATARVVTITTPGGTTSAVPSAANSFTVTTLVGTDYTPLISSMVGVLVQGASPASTRQAAYGPNLSVPVGVFIPSAPPVNTRNATYGPILSPLVGITVGSLLQAMAPTRIEPGATVTLTLTGTGLDQVTSLRVMPAAGLTVGPLTASADGTSLTAQISADAAAVRGARRVTPFTATGPVGTSATLGIPLYVGFRPAISSISPILQTVGNSFTLTINGTNLDYANEVRFEPADGVAVLNPPAINADGTQATVTVVIDGMATGGQRVVVIEGPFGPSDNTGGANNTFNVSRPVAAVFPLQRSPGTPAQLPAAALATGWPDAAGLFSRSARAMPGIRAWRQPLAVCLAEPLSEPVPKSGGGTPGPGRLGDRSPLLLAAMVTRGYRGPPGHEAFIA